jgi:hypothetical protein
MILSAGKFPYLYIKELASHNDRMPIEPSDSRDRPTIRDLFPDLTDEQLQGVQETLHGYLNALWRIYQRLRRERPEAFDSDERPS